MSINADEHCQTINQSVNQSINKSVNQLPNKPINCLINLEVTGNQDNDPFLEKPSREKTFLLFLDKYSSYENMFKNYSPPSGEMILEDLRE